MWIFSTDLYYDKDLVQTNVYGRRAGALRRNLARSCTVARIVDGFGAIYLSQYELVLETLLWMCLTTAAYIRVSHINRKSFGKYYSADLRLIRVAWRTSICGDNNQSLIRILTLIRQSDRRVDEPLDWMWSSSPIDISSTRGAAYALPT